MRVSGGAAALLVMALGSGWVAGTASPPAPPLTHLSPAAYHTGPVESARPGRSGVDGYAARSGVDGPREAERRCRRATRRRGA